VSTGTRTLGKTSVEGPLHIVRKDFPMGGGGHLLGFVLDIHLPFLPEHLDRNPPGFVHVTRCKTGSARRSAWDGGSVLLSAC